MNRIYVLPKDELGEEIYQRIYLLIKKNRGNWATRGATFGLIGGILFISLGALLWSIVPFLSHGGLKSFLNVSETVSFVLPLPLLALGAYCLDLLEEKHLIFSLQANSQPAGFASRYRLRPQRPHQN